MTMTKKSERELKRTYFVSERVYSENQYQPSEGLTTSEKENSPNQSTVGGIDDE